MAVVYAATHRNRPSSPSRCSTRSSAYARASASASCARATSPTPSSTPARCSVLDDDVDRGRRGVPGDGAARGRDASRRSREREGGRARRSTRARDRRSAARRARRRAREGHRPSRHQAREPLRHAARARSRCSTSASRAFAKASTGDTGATRTGVLARHAGVHGAGAGAGGRTTDRRAHRFVGRRRDDVHAAHRASSCTPARTPAQLMVAAATAMPRSIQAVAEVPPPSAQSSIAR